LEVAVTEKSEFNASDVQRWSQLFGKEGPKDLALFRKWLHQSRWESAGEIVKTLLKRFRKSPLDPRTR
jgi:hypothetical protein